MMAPHDLAGAVAHGLQEVVVGALDSAVHAELPMTAMERSMAWTSAFWRAASVICSVTSVANLTTFATRPLLSSTGL